MALTEKPWLKNYAPGWPANIEVKYESINELLDDTFKKFAGKVAYHNMGGDLTYKQLDEASKHFGAYLISRGLERGDKIALMMPNLLQYPVALFGALRAGLIVVNTNPLYTAREMKHQFIDANVKAIIIAENFAHNLEKILPDTNIKVIITTSLGEMLGFFKGAVVNFVVKRVKRMVPKFTLPNTVTFSEALKQGKKFTLDIHYGSADEVVALQYTGGTTGVAKGAMLTNGNMVSAMLMVQGLVAPYINFEEDTVGLSPLPLYHIFAFVVNGLALMSVGTKNVLVTNPRDLSSINKEFKNHKINLMTGVNTLFNGLLNNKEFQSLDTSSLKITIGGGMAVQNVVAERWEEVTGCYLSQGYGLTESTSVLSVNPFERKLGKLGTIGLPFPSTDIKIVDDQGNDLPPNTAGELIAKGPQIMKGYYNKPEETANSIRDGWFYTGDIAEMDEDGFFKIVDRKKDMILVSGFNVFPNEIEEVLAAHPKVLEVAAIGVPDPKSTEVVKVFVVKKDKSLTEDEVIQYCRENLTGYKVPKQVAFLKELPKSNVGKILRRELRDK